MNSYLNVSRWSFQRLIFLLMLLLGLSKNLMAHPMPNSLLTLQVKDDYIKVQAKMPLADLMGVLQTKDISKMNIQTLKPYFESHIQATTEDRTWTTTIDSVYIAKDDTAVLMQYQEVVLNFNLYPASTLDLRNFDLHYDVIMHQLITHKAMVFVNEDWQAGHLLEDIPLEVGVIRLDVSSGEITPLRVNLENGSEWKGFRSMIVMGADHIKEGLDHILFLLSLLLISPLVSQGSRWSLFQGTRYTLKRFLKISLMFTIGHSLSLVTGAYDIIPFNIGYIEVLIALTIVLSAIHVLVPFFQRKEAWIGFFFGIIHGLAFSESISGLDLSISNKALSILGFNLGIESMQLLIMLLVFPVLLLSKFKVYNFIRIGFALLTLVLSIVWLNERVQFLA